MASLPYAGAPVSQLFRERWMTSTQVGDIKPVGAVQVRHGHLDRSFHAYPGLGYPPFGEYPGALGSGFWYPDWHVDSDWEDLDAIIDIKLDQSFDSNGICTLTMTMDNKLLVPTTGAASILYHLVESGYYSPLRGYVGPGRPDPSVAKTPFFNLLPNAQIRVQQGYGEDTLVTTFLGLIDDIDTESIPNQVTVTARDHGGVMVDERYFGWAKEMLVPTPLTFAPSFLAEQSRLVGGAAQASSSQSGYPPSAVTDDNNSQWRSSLVNDPDQTQWIEITLPAGKYSNYLVSVPFNSMEMYVGIKPTGYTAPDGKHRQPNVNGNDINGQLDDNGWYNPNGQSVPNSDGWKYFERIGATSAGNARWYSMNGEFQFGDGTIMRLGFRNLHSNGVFFPEPQYEAGVTRFLANQRKFTQNAIAGRYVLINDVSDIVRCTLRWCGFKGWEVEDSGVNLLEPYVADQSQTFMDVINTVKDMTGFTFFMGEPRDDSNDQDLGYPIFRNNRVLENKTAPTEFIDDKMLLTDAKVSLSNADDHCIIRCRGIAKDNGVPLGGDQIKRIMFAYIPPWVGGQAKHQAGVFKPITHTDELFTHLSDCQFGCYLIAIQIALLKYTAIIDLPGNPGIGLDTLQSVIDRTQGLNSRLYITNRTTEMKFGNDGFWTTELGGSLVDTPDMTGAVKDFKAAVQQIDRGQRNPWIRKRQGKALSYGFERG